MIDGISNEVSNENTDKTVRTSEQLNELNREYWTKANEKLNNQLADIVVAREVYNRVRKEVGTCCLEKQSNVNAIADEVFAFQDEVLVDKSPRIKTAAISEQAQKAALARKPNAFPSRIEEIVRACPDISERELLEKLKNEAGPGSIIEDIADGAILVRGRVKPYKESGLKYMLSRAKDEVRSQQPASAKTKRS